MKTSKSLTSMVVASVLQLSMFAATTASADTVTLTPALLELRAIYKELVEINTTDSAGDCTQAVKAMAVHLKAAGYADQDMQLIVPPGGPKKGNLVVRLKGSSEKKALMQLAHVDVVEAKREDWTRDPFKLIEENGMFYARGASDNKSMAASFVVNMMRYKRENLRPRRDLILALTCDEEIIPSEFDGVEFLVKNHRELIDAEIVLNEGGGGYMDKNGKRITHGIQAGEKIFLSFQLEVTNKGGHSSLPPRDNAIYHLADGISRLGKFDFPFKLSATTRSYFERMSKIESGQKAADMLAILRDPPDMTALERLYDELPFYNSSVRTTCVATMIDAGHATNALPQRAKGVVNCRILPGESPEEVQKTLVRVMADDQIKITPMGVAVLSPIPPLTPELMSAIEGISNDMWPGVPVVPTMFVAATDGRFLNNVGIWTYGVSGRFATPDTGGAHGLNERMRVESLYESTEYLYRLAKRLAE